MSAVNDDGCFNIEILLKKQRNTNVSNDGIYQYTFAHMNKLLKLPRILKCVGITDAFLKENVEEIAIGGSVKMPLEFEKGTFYAYNVTEHRAEIETLENESDNNSEEIPASNHWILPNREFIGLWESLIYQPGLKENILQFAKTIMLFSQRNIDVNVIACNKLVLLHGPPGTGKTSLSKALAQKLAIHLKHIYAYTHLFEINSHSIFSKWFSESGKLVLRLFGNIREVAEHKQSFVIILIDEVESIAYARDSVSANEPSDSLRVVNAVLTQLDNLRRYPNILVLTTSNLTATIDDAFIDRADLKQFIGEPSIEAIYEIFSMAIQELVTVKIIDTNVELLTYDEAIKYEEYCVVVNDPLRIEQLASQHLLQISRLSVGLSGRTLRKLPFLAHAWFIRSESTSIEQYLKALKDAVAKHMDDAQIIQKKV